MIKATVVAVVVSLALATLLTFPPPWKGTTAGSSPHSSGRESSQSGSLDRVIRSIVTSGNSVPSLPVRASLLFGTPPAVSAWAGPFYQMYRRGPRWLGMWNGSPDGHVCSVITKFNDDAFWNEHSEACVAIVAREFDSLLVLVHAVAYVAVVVASVLVVTCSACCFVASGSAKSFFVGRIAAAPALERARSSAEFMAKAPSFGDQ